MDRGIISCKFTCLGSTFVIWFIVPCIIVASANAARVETSSEGDEGLLPTGAVLKVDSYFFPG